jgi:hypothetical protein
MEAGRFPGIRNPKFSTPDRSAPIKIEYVFGVNAHSFITHFQMQMASPAVPGIASKAKDLAFSDGIIRLYQIG